MKNFLIFFNNDKDNVKMINRTDKNFELIIDDNIVLKQVIEKINNKTGKIDVVWQMKHKLSNIMLFKNCIFSEPIDNSFNGKIGKKIKVTFDSIKYYSDSELYIGKKIPKSNSIYKNSIQLIRMLKLYNIKLSKND
jgi:hypothetical protein